MSAHDRPRNIADATRPIGHGVDPWLILTLLFGIGSFGLTYLIIVLNRWQFLIPTVVATVIIGVMLCFNPQYYLRRLATIALMSAVTVESLPAITLHLKWNAGNSLSFVIGKSPFVAPLFLGFALCCVLIEYSRTERAATANSRSNRRWVLASCGVVIALSLCVAVVMVGKIDAVVHDTSDQVMLPRAKETPPGYSKVGVTVANPIPGHVYKVYFRRKGTSDWSDWPDAATPDSNATMKYGVYEFHVRVRLQDTTYYSKPVEKKLEKPTAHVKVERPQDVQPP
jgi:hypothetical protein